MRIDTCVVSSDANPLYLDFFPLVHRMWRDLVGIRCVLVLIASEVPKELRNLSEDVILVPPIDGLEDGFSAQCIRLLAPQFVGARDAVLISDIDLIPMRRDYFISAAQAAPDDTFIVYRTNALPGSEELPICFNAALPATWSQLVEPAAGVLQAIAALKRWRAEIASYKGYAAAGWTTDQRILFRKVREFDPRRVRFLTDAETNFKRLDRSRVGEGGPLRWRHLVMASGGAYSDCHMPRPMGRFADINGRIADAALSRNPLSTVLVKAARSIRNAGGGLLKPRREQL